MTQRKGQPVTPFYCLVCRGLVLARYRDRGYAYCEDHVRGRWQNYSTLLEAPNDTVGGDE